MGSQESVAVGAGGAAYLLLLPLPFLQPFLHPILSLPHFPGLAMTPPPPTQ